MTFRTRLLGLLAVAALAASIGHANAQGFSGYVSGDNILQNGDFAYDRRNEGASVTINPNPSGTTVMTEDRWQVLWAVSSSSAGNPAAQRVATSTGLSVVPNELKLTMSATPATSTPAALELTLQQQIEAQDIADLDFGTATAQPVAYQFWAKSSVASEVLSVALQNAAATRTYTTSCTLSSTASTWTQCLGVIPGDTAGTWVNNRTAVTAAPLAAIFAISPGCGSTFQAASAGAWLATNTPCLSTTTNLPATASATLEVTAAKLERGVSQTYFKADPAPIALYKLNRFYRKTFQLGLAPAANAGVGTGEACAQVPIASSSVSLNITLEPPMVETPNALTFNPGTTGTAWRDETASSTINIQQTQESDPNKFYLSSVVGGTLLDRVCIHYTLDTQS